MKINSQKTTINPQHQKVNETLNKFLANKISQNLLDRIQNSALLSLSETSILQLPSSRQPSSLVKGHDLENYFFSLRILDKVTRQEGRLTCIFNPNSMEARLQYKAQEPLQKMHKKPTPTPIELDEDFITSLSQDKLDKLFAIIEGTHPYIQLH